MVPTVTCQLHVLHAIFSFASYLTINRMSDDHYSTRGNNLNPEPLLHFVSPSSAIRKPTLLQIALKRNVQLLSQSYLAFPGKRGSVTLAEIPPPTSKFAEIEGGDSVSLDHTAAGEKGKNAQFSQVNLRRSLLYARTCWVTGAC